MNKLQSIFGSAAHKLIDLDLHAIEITPDIAQGLLDEMRVNRNLVKNNQDKIEQAILSGSFVLNGEPLIVDQRGRLLNGQHRCRAVVNTGKPIKSLVVVVMDECPDDAFETMDSGRTRKHTDYLSIEGVSYPSQTAAAIAAILRIQKNGYFDYSAGGPTSSEVIDFRLSNSLFIDKFHRHMPGKVLPSAVIGLILWYGKSHGSLAESFISAVETGADLKLGSPEWVLRERMLLNKQSVRSKVPQRICAALAIKAWNAKVSNTPIKILKYSTDEPFPKFI